MCKNHTKISISLKNLVIYLQKPPQPCPKKKIQHTNEDDDNNAVKKVDGLMMGLW